MEEKYHRDSAYSGFILSLKDLIYIIACPVCTWNLKVFPKFRYLAYVGGIGLGISMFLFGPNKLFTGIPDNPYIAIVASCMNGWFSVYIFLPAI